MNTRIPTQGSTMLQAKQSHIKGGDWLGIFLATIDREIFFSREILKNTN